MKISNTGDQTKYKNPSFNIFQDSIKIESENKTQQIQSLKVTSKDEISLEDIASETAKFYSDLKEVNVEDLKQKILADLKKFSEQTCYKSITKYLEKNNMPTDKISIKKNKEYLLNKFAELSAVSHSGWQQPLNKLRELDIQLKKANGKNPEQIEKELSVLNYSSKMKCPEEQIVLLKECLDNVLNGKVAFVVSSTNKTNTDIAAAQAEPAKNSFFGIPTMKIFMGVSQNQNLDSDASDASDLTLLYHELLHTRHMVQNKIPANVTAPDLIMEEYYAYYNSLKFEGSNRQIGKNVTPQWMKAVAKYMEDIGRYQHPIPAYLKNTPGAMDVHNNLIRALRNGVDIPPPIN